MIPLKTQHYEYASSVDSRAYNRESETVKNVVHGKWLFVSRRWRELYTKRFESVGSHCCHTCSVSILKHLERAQTMEREYNNYENHDYCAQIYRYRW